MNSGIYKITNLKNNKIYIGRAVDLKNRKWRHWCFLHPNQYKQSSLKTEVNMEIHQDMMKSQNDSDFNFEIIEYCSENLLDEREQYYIKKFNSMAPNGYNHTLGGQTYPHLKGEQRPNHKITQQEAKIIREELKKGKSVKEIQLIIPQATMGMISAINTGRTWHDDKEIYPLSKLNGVKKFTDNQVKQIRELRKSGISTIDLATKYNTTTSQISSLTTGKIRKDVDGDLTKQFKFSKEQVIKYRTQYKSSKLTMKDIWKNSDVVNKISYDAFCDMLKGKTYKEYPIYNKNDYNPQNKKMQSERYEQIYKLYLTGNFTKKEIANQIGCSERTVYRAIESYV